MTVIRNRFSQQYDRRLAGLPGRAVGGGDRPVFVPPPPLPDPLLAITVPAGTSLHLGQAAIERTPLAELTAAAGSALYLGQLAPAGVPPLADISVPTGTALRLGQGDAPVVQTVWTPERDQATDQVTAASWASIPISTLEAPRFVKVDGWDMVAGITADLLANGFDPQTMAWGNGKVGSTLKAWTGLAYDPVSKKSYHARGGGHADSSINGIWEHDFRKLRYSIVDMPTDPNDPIDQWPIEYKTINGTFTSGIDFNDVTDFSVTPMAITSYTTYMDAAGRFHEQMPSDGRPASMHYYNGIGKLGDWVWTTRNRKFSYNLVTGETRTDHWTKDGQSFIPDINNDLIYHAASDTYYGKFAAANASFDFSKLSGADPLDVKSVGLPSGTATTSETVMVQKDADSLILFKPSTDTVGAFVAEFDMSTETWGPKRDLVNASGSTRPWYVQEMIPAIFIPDWGRQGSILFHFTWSGDADDGEPLAKDWWLLDYETLEPQRLGAIAGYPSEHGEHTGNKFFITEMAGMTFAFYLWVRDEESALYTMRLS